MAVESGDILLESLASASLRDSEHRAVQRLVGMLRSRFGKDLHAVWLYGSRARGERPGPESDIDLVVLTAAGRDDREAIYRLAAQAAEAEGVYPHDVSIRVGDLAWLAERRRINSFFIQEVDRDKLVLHAAAP